MNEKIMLVEDDDAMAMVAKDALASRGYKVSVFSGAEPALAELERKLPDLLVLDIRLKGLSGIEMCRILKQNDRTASLPIIMLTSLSKEKDKIDGLRTGADDYVTKPFSVGELNARVEALLRRTKSKGALKPAPLKAGPVELRPDSREVLVDGRRVELTRLEFDLLHTLLARPKVVHSYDSLASDVWGEDRVATSHTVTVTVSRLKDKLGKADTLVEAVPGVGYRLRPV